MTTDPIVCTLRLDESLPRVSQLEELSTQLLDVRQQPLRAVLRFPADAEELVREFVVDESRCCTFLGFEVDAAGDAVLLSITAPDGTQPLLAELLAGLGPSASREERNAAIDRLREETPLRGLKVRLMSG